MDNKRAQELRIEEEYPDGKAGTGFSYSFGLSRIDDMITVDFLFPTETMRLFFPRDRFIQFAKEANVVVNEISI